MTAGFTSRGALFKLFIDMRKGEEASNVILFNVSCAYLLNDSFMTPLLYMYNQIHQCLARNVDIETLMSDLLFK